MATDRLLFPRLGNLYAALTGPSVVLLRVVTGAALMTHGWSKIQDPMRMVAFVERVGFAPGEFWSPALAITEFFGGLFLALGFVTRFAAAGAMTVLLVTVYYHWILQGEGYGGAEKSILWSAMCFYFVVHGGRYLAVDRFLKREL